MDMRDLAPQTRELAIDFGGGAVLHLTYRPYVLEVGEIIDGARGMQAGVEQIARILVSWDFTKDERPIPPDEGGIRQIPGAVLTRIERAIGEDLSVPLENGSPSSAGSGTTA